MKLDGAVLMECLQGNLLKSETVANALAWEIGSFLARIHLEHAKGYGDLTDPAHLNDDPRIPFTMKFEEGLEECKGHLPDSLLKICRRRFYKGINLLLSADGPCIIHRDFRPGNILAAHGKVQGIIDWSSGRGGFAEDDFCPLEFGEWPTGCKKKDMLLPEKLADALKQSGCSSRFHCQKRNLGVQKLKALSIQSPLS